MPSNPNQIVSPETSKTRKERKEHIDKLASRIASRSKRIIDPLMPVDLSQLKKNFESIGIDLELAMISHRYIIRYRVNRPRKLAEKAYDLLYAEVQ